MRPERFVISDRSWELIEPQLSGTSRSCGVTAKDNRLFLEAVLWKVIYIFFNNDLDGYAAKNAMTLQKMLKHKGTD